MRTAFLGLILCATAVSQTKPAILEGKAVNSITGEALRKVELSLATNLLSDEMEAMMAQFTGESPAPAGAKRKSYSATTDAAGKFHIDAEPGDYYLTAKRAGFGDYRYHPQGKYNLDGRVHLTAGDELTGVELRMVPQAAVSGKVVDEDGDPVGGAMVTAQSWSYAGGKRRMVQADSGQANDRGEFRLGKLPPGRYYLSANQFNINPMAEAPPAPKDGAPEMGYVSTYYPRVVDAALAAPIDVTAGADLTGFQIQLQKSRVVRLKGKAVGSDGAPLKSAQIMLMSPSHLGAMQMKMLNDPQGRFEIANLQPGSYVVMTMQMGGSSPTVHMQPVTIPADGLDSFQLGGQPEGDVKGSIVVAGDAKIPLKGLRVTLGNEEMTGMPVFAAVADDGAFTLSKVSGVPYEVSLSRVPDGAYLQTIEWGGRDTAGKPVDFSAGFTGALKITLGTDGGAFETTIKRDDKPLAGVTVALLPADPARRFSAAVKSGETDAAGHISFKDVQPADYLAFAWEDVEDGAWLYPGFLKAVENQGVKVSIGPKGHEKADLSLIKTAK
jgi:hypothetical protein